MTNKTILWLLLGFLTITLAAGCGCEDADISTYEVILDSPAQNAVVSSLSPTFSWHDQASCLPDHLNLYLKENGTVYFLPINVIPGNKASFTLLSSLQPGREYVWQMKAVSANNVAGPISEAHYFFTGPVCSGDALAAPDLQEPVDDAWITDHDPQMFSWTYDGGCLPESFDYQFASDPGFTNLLDSGTVSNHTQHLFKSFPNCSTIFWRVAARDGSTLGPWSDPYYFNWVTDTNCWQVHWISLNSAKIRGQIYWDDCPNTHWLIPLNAPLAQNCLITGGIGVHGNGIYDSPDIPLDDVRIDLGSGPCPSTGLDSTKSGYSGYYEFTVLTPGVYCLSVTKAQSVPDVNLVDGLWTEPLTENTVAKVTLDLPEGMHIIEQKIGWDDYEVIYRIVELNENTFCRAGDDMNCREVEVVKKDLLYEVK